jgi:hypothetical protein
MHIYTLYRQKCKKRKHCAFHKFRGITTKEENHTHKLSSEHNGFITNKTRNVHIM